VSEKVKKFNEKKTTPPEPEDLRKGRQEKRWLETAVKKKTSGRSDLRLQVKEKSDWVL